MPRSAGDTNARFKARTPDYARKAVKFQAESGWHQAADRDRSSPAPAVFPGTPYPLAGDPQCEHLPSIPFQRQGRPTWIAAPESIIRNGTATLHFPPPPSHRSQLTVYHSLRYPPPGDPPPAGARRRLGEPGRNPPRECAPATGSTDRHGARFPVPAPRRRGSGFRGH